VQRELREDPSKIANFLEEVLRLESPFVGHFRKVVKKGGITLHGVHLEENARVMVLWASGNRDGSVFPDPDEFSMERDNRKAHFGFGHGIHLCLVARLELQIVLEEFLAATCFILEGRGFRSPKYVQSAFVRSLEELNICIS